MVASEKLEYIQKFADTLKNGLFSSRDTTSGAIKYAYELIETLKIEDRFVAYTALHVVLNSVSEDIIKLAK